MSYSIRVRLNGRTPWLENSFDAVNSKLRTGGVAWHLFEKEWEEEYGYRLGHDKFNMINKVIFPSEEEATMFLLRWS